MKNYIRSIQKFNQKLYNELRKIHYQKKRILHHEFSKKSKKFIKSEYEKAQSIYRRINIFRKTFIEKYGNLEIEELHNEKLLKHLNELLNMINM